MSSSRKRSRHTMSPRRLFSPRGSPSSSSSSQVVRRQSNLGLYPGPSIRIKGFPEVMRVKLTYATYTTLTSASSTSVIYRGNSVYDPEYAAGGGQPNYFDTYASLYQQYRVMGSKIEVEAINNSATTTSRIVLMPTDSSTSPTNGLNAIGNPFTQHKIVGCNTAHPYARLAKKMSTAVINGHSNAQIMGDPNYSAAVTANPTDEWFWVVYADDHSFAAAQVIHLDVVLTYDVIFSDKKSQNLN